jgi:hypothetical protein
LIGFNALNLSSEVESEKETIFKASVSIIPGREREELVILVKGKQDVLKGTTVN